MVYFWMQAVVGFQNAVIDVAFIDVTSRFLDLRVSNDQIHEIYSK